MAIYLLILNNDDYLNATIDNGAASPKLSPRGYDVILDPFYSGSTSSPQAVLIPYVSKSEQTIASVYNKRAYLGWDFTKRDNDNYLTFLPEVSIPSISPLAKN